MIVEVLSLKLMHGRLNFEICWKTASLVQNHFKIIKISNKKKSTKISIFPKNPKVSHPILKKILQCQKQ